MPFSADQIKKLESSDRPFGGNPDFQAMLAEVKRMPKTVDGVHLIPEVDRVWYVDQHGDLDSTTWHPLCGRGKEGWGTENPADDFWNEFTAYGSKEAALAAKRAGTSVFRHC